MKKFSAVVLSLSLTFVPTVAFAKEPAEKLSITEENEVFDQVNKGLNQVNSLSDEATTQANKMEVQSKRLSHSINGSQIKANSLSEHLIELIKMRNKLLSNSEEINDLSNQIYYNREEIRREFNRISSNNITPTEEQLTEVITLSEQIVSQIKNSKQVLESIGKEMVRLTNFIIKKDFKSALTSTETIISLQEDQINILTEIKSDQQQLLNVLQQIK